MSKTIEEAAREFADKEYEVGEIDWEALYKGYYWGHKDTLSLPLSQRLTDEERERMRTKYQQLCGMRYISACGFRIELEEIFGKEFFREGEV